MNQSSNSPPRPSSAPAGFDQHIRRAAAASLLGVTPKTMSNWAIPDAEGRTKGPKVYRVGTTPVYRYSDCLEYLQRSTEAYNAPVVTRPAQLKAA